MIKDNTVGTTDIKISEVINKIESFISNMGINISVRKVTGKFMGGTWVFKTVPYYSTEKQDWFDSSRYSGDRDFVVENEFEFIDNDIVIEQQELARPKDFNKCREWVKLNIPEANKQRLLNTLDKMEQDRLLCFTWSW